jgi:hypothetical protein
MTRHTTRWITLAVALAMLTVTMPAMATHSSVGAPHTHLTDPDEFDPDSGLLTPDIPHAEHPQKGEQVSVGEETSPYHLQFHENLEDSGLPARDAPYDQSGQRYTDCTTAEEAGEDYAPHDLPKNKDQCYIGYMDQIVEQAFPTGPGLVTKAPIDLLYPANPSPDDGYCRGEEDTNEVTENDDLDTAITNLQRATDSECSGLSHSSYLTGDLRIDTSLFEAGNEEAGTTQGNDMGSGAWSIEGFASTHTFLFGQPHPDAAPIEKSNPLIDDNERWTAGQGPFGPNPTELGNPLHDLTGACGDRTEECKLLEPNDIIQYDPWTWSDEFADVKTPTQPRVCAFTPQYSFAVPTDSSIDRDQGLCGNTGYVQDEFYHDVTAGGFGVDGAATWATNLPGWGWGVSFLGLAAGQTTTYAFNYLQDDYEERAGFINYYAVNPIVPDREGDLRCVTPNILNNGDDGVLKKNGVDTTEFSDPGIYGTYQADAIDTDVYPHPYRDQLETVNDETHDEVRGVVGLAEDTLEDASNATEAVDEVVPEELEEPVPEEVEDTADEQLDQATNTTAEALDRAGPFEGSQTPAFAQLGEDNQEPFEGSIDKGLSCTVTGDLVFRPEDVTLQGGLNFQADVFESTLTLKDPTVLDEGLPAPESETDEGYWQTDTYTFSGNAFAFLDFNQNEQFDNCPGANLDPGDDLCPWESLWDAYNEQCTNRAGTPCPEVLKQKGYNVEPGDGNGDPSKAGVGMYFTATLEGPILVTSETGTADVEQIQDHTEVLGGTGDKVCIVGTSEGFHEKLPNHVDGSQNAYGLPGALCEEDADAATLVTDAFDDQSGTNRGGFSADVEWAKLSPTPAATDNGVDESLCVSGVWSVGPTDSGFAGDTAPPNNIGLEEGTVHEFSHWQSLETGTDTQPDRASC